MSFAVKFTLLRRVPRYGLFIFGSMRGILMFSRRGEGKPSKRSMVCLQVRKSAPTWIPNSKGNRLLLGYRIPKEIGSYLDTDFQRKSAPTWTPIFQIRKSAPIWIPESRREIGSNMDTGIPHAKFRFFETF
ncbi:hypothetical protein RIR_jg13834.t1 [Rhizophagus irregularis DAOM 181602=DAOM 197198]|nr:hypothetical protein RIR_jg13834.t1 [Rhizophagus irregularis DAOM 181602=DAOM 197198]